jgi:hypothetical protein
VIGRIVASEKEWNVAAVSLIDNATRIACVPSSHAGTLWEIDQIIARDYLQKTVFIMPPSNPTGWGSPPERLEKSQLEDDWAKLVIEMGRLGLRFPPFKRAGLFSDGGGLLFCFRNDSGKLNYRKYYMSARSIFKGFAVLLVESPN